MSKVAINNDGFIIGLSEDGILPPSAEKLWYLPKWDGTSWVETATSDVISAAQLVEIKQNGEIYSLNGTDYKVPFMKDDADGLLQVKAAFDLGVVSTNIHFTNGTVMPITTSEFMDFAIWFVNKRNEFFL